MAGHDNPASDMSRLSSGGAQLSKLMLFLVAAQKIHRHGEHELALECH
jgi:hypothetical protein